MKLRNGGSDQFITVPEGVGAAKYLAAFLARDDVFSSDWVQLDSGEYVRYDCVISVRAGNGGEPRAAGFS